MAGGIDPWLAFIFGWTACTIFFAAWELAAARKTGGNGAAPSSGLRTQIHNSDSIPVLLPVEERPL